MRDISIFISSPGDVAEERLISKRVIERLAYRFADRAALRPCFWEHLPLSADASFQVQLPKPADFDVMVMMLYMRIGTRLESEMQRKDGTRYESGTEYEYENALEGFEAKGSPRLLVYRKKSREAKFDFGAPEEELMERFRQKKMVDQFEERWSRWPDGSNRKVFRHFESSAEFEELLEHHLRGTLEEILAEPAEQGKRQVFKAIDWDTAVHGSPFRGLRCFDVEHRAIYFGRTKAISEVLDRLRKAAAKAYSFVLVFGKSGVGKSSFIRAGVLPFLIEPGVVEGYGLWRYAIFTPSEATGDLLDGLAAALLSKSALPQLATAASEGEIADLLRKSPEAVVTLIRRELNALIGATQTDQQLGEPRAAGLALLIDPVEEIFTRPGTTAENRELFINALTELTRSKFVWALGSMRSDFYERCAEHPKVLELLDGYGEYRLAPPTRAETGQMIRLPAQLAGLEFEENKNTGSLDEALWDEASADPGALPLLEFTLDEIYKRSKSAGSKMLTFQAYQELGGLYGAVRTRAEETLAEVEKALGTRLEAAFDGVFSALVGFKEDEGQSSVRLVSPLQRLEEDADRKVLVEAFIESRLFMTDIDDQRQPLVTVSHEALLRHWPRLEKWIQTNTNFLRRRNRVDAAAKRWRDEGKDVAYLLAHGKPLEDGRDILREHRQKLEPAHIEFIEKSIEHADDQRIKAARRNRVISAVLMTLAVLSIIFAAFALVKAREADKDAQRANDEAKRADKLLETAEYRRIIATNSLNDISIARDKTTARAQECEDLARFVFEDIGARLEPTTINLKVIGDIAKKTLEFYFKKDRLEDEGVDAKKQLTTTRFEVSEALYRMGRYQDAIMLTSLILPGLNTTSPEDAAFSSKVYELSGRSQSQLGQYTLAEKSFKQAEEWARQAGKNAPALQEKLNVDLGELHRFMGRYADSEKELRLPDATNATSDHLEALGELFRYENRLPEAETCFNKGLEASQAELSLVQTKGDAAKSPDQKDKLGRELEKDTDKVLKAQSNLGVLYYDEARYQESESKLQMVLQADLNAKGPDHPLVAVDQYKLARVLVKLENLSDADTMLNQSQKTLALALGSDPNQRMAKCLEALAELRMAQQRYPEAEDLAKKVLTIREAIFKDYLPHPEVWKAMLEVAGTCDKTNIAEDAAEAADLRTKATAMREEHLRRESAGGASCGDEL